MGRMTRVIITCIVTLCIWECARAALPSSCSSCQRSGRCNPPDCFCCRDDMGMAFPTSQIPQIVFFTFDDAVTDQVAGFYRDLFDPSRKNPNGCPISMTLFISHDNTKYNLVSEFHQRGMEIASHSVTHDAMNETNFYQEAKLQKENLARLARIPIEDVTGWRSPFLKPTGDLQPEALRELGYVYDATLTYSKRNYRTKPPGPFTLDFGWPFVCQVKPCPKSAHPGFWEVPVVSLMDYKARYDCVYVDGCMNAPPDEERAYQFLWDNFHSYYSTTRMPFGINMHPSWFYYPDRLKAMDRFILKLSSMQDVYIVSVDRMIKWMKQPTPLNELYTFPQWACDGREKSVAGQGRDYAPKKSPPSIVPPNINRWQARPNNARSKSSNAIISIGKSITMTQQKKFRRNQNTQERNDYFNMPNLMADKLREVVKPALTRSVPAPPKPNPEARGKKQRGQRRRHMLWRPAATRQQPASPSKPQTNSVSQKVPSNPSPSERNPSIQDLFGKRRTPQTVVKQPRMLSNRVDQDPVSIRKYQSSIVAKPQINKVRQQDFRRYQRNGRGQTVSQPGTHFGAINIWSKSQSPTAAPAQHTRRTGKPVISNSQDFDRLLRRIQMPATSGRVNLTPLPTKPTYRYTGSTRRQYTPVTRSRMLHPTKSPTVRLTKPNSVNAHYIRTPSQLVYTTQSPVAKQQRLQRQHFLMTNETSREQRSRDSYQRQQQLRELREKQFALRTQMHLNLQRSLLRQRQERNRQLLRNRANQIRPVRRGPLPVTLRRPERVWDNFIRTMMAPLQ